MNFTLATDLTSGTAQPAPLPMTPPRGGGSIVVVEDPIIAGLVRSVLQRKDYRVLALRASEGIKLLLTASADVGMLITNLPAVFTEFAGRVPLLYLAASPDPAVAAPFRASRMLTKPFHPDQLLSCVEQLLPDV